MISLAGALTVVFVAQTPSPPASPAASPAPPSTTTAPETPAEPEPSSSTESPSPVGDVRATRTTLLLLDLAASGVETSDAGLVNGMVAQRLSEYDAVDVVSQNDLRAMVSLEAEKQSMGCDTSSCLAEIAGAMGARYVVSGTVGRLGTDVFLVQLSLFDASVARAVQRSEARAADLGGLADQLPPAVDELLQPLALTAPPLRARPVEAAPVVEDDGGMPWLTIAGATVLAVGAVSTVTLLVVVAAAEMAMRDTSGAVGRGGKDIARPAGLAALVVSGLAGVVGVVGGGVLVAGVVME